MISREEDLAEAIELEKRARTAVEKLANKLAEVGAPIWHWGDGFGAGVMAILAAAAQRKGLPWGPPLRSTKRPQEERSSASRYLREEVIARDGLKCTYCKIALKAKDVTMDHRVPLISGGKTTIENLCVCCKTCNSRKGRKLYFLVKLETLQ